MPQKEVLTFRKIRQPRKITVEIADNCATFNIVKPKYKDLKTRKVLTLTVSAWK